MYNLKQIILFILTCVNSNPFYAARIQTTYTASRKEVPLLFFDRQSDTLLMLGQGFGGTKEAMADLADSCINYDIICFDYRWTTDRYFFFWPSTLSSPIQSIFLDGEQEARAAYAFAQQKKAYKKIIALGNCYSAALFIVMQANGHKEGMRFFDGIIADSTWLCINDLICRMNNQYPALTSSFISFLSSLVKEFCIDSYLKELANSPILFIHGKNDLLIPLTELEKIKQAIEKCPVYEWITPYGHSESFRCNPSLYRDTCEEFISCLTPHRPSRPQAF